MYRASESDGDLVELAFESQIAPGVSPWAVLRLAQQAWSHNTRVGIGGALIVSGPHLTQVLEGEASIMLPLAARILGDERHHSIQIRRFDRLEARRYAGWRTEGIEGIAQRAGPQTCPLLRIEPRPAGLQAVPRPLRAAECGYGG